LNHKLLILNGALACVLVYAGWQFRRQSQATQMQQAAVLSQTTKPAPPPPYQALPVPPAVLPAGYAQIAQKMLFDRSRNPNVVIEVVPPPPPPPMPPLPIFHGMMNLGTVTVFLSVGKGQQQAIHLGDTIGQFKLLDVNEQEVSLEWNGKVVRKAIDEMTDHSAPEPQEATVARTDNTPAAAPPPPAVKSAIGPGADTGRGIRVCDPNDNMPEGSVADGFRKVNRPTPFGTSCFWEPVSR
jgi:hypothetical protein